MVGISGHAITSTVLPTHATNRQAVLKGGGHSLPTPRSPGLIWEGAQWQLGTPSHALEQEPLCTTRRTLLHESAGWRVTPGIGSVSSVAVLGRTGLLEKHPAVFIPIHLFEGRRQCPVVPSTWSLLAWVRQRRQHVPSRKHRVLQFVTVVFVVSSLTAGPWEGLIEASNGQLALELFPRL